MYTKNRIQQILEFNEYKFNFIQSLQNIMEKYTITDSIFFVKNGKVSEAVNGYFEVIDECQTLKDAVNKCDMSCMGIRIINNDKFQVGNIKQYISECDRSKTIMDIDKYAVCE